MTIADVRTSGRKLNKVAAEATLRFGSLKVGPVRVWKYDTGEVAVPFAVEDIKYFNQKDAL